jgi:hypothetical protein
VPPPAVTARVTALHPRGAVDSPRQPTGPLPAGWSRACGQPLAVLARSVHPQPGTRCGPYMQVDPREHSLTVLVLADAQYVQTAHRRRRRRVDDRFALPSDPESDRRWRAGRGRSPPRGGMGHARDAGCSSCGVRTARYRSIPRHKRRSAPAGPAVGRRARGLRYDTTTPRREEPASHPIRDTPSAPPEIPTFAWKQSAQ